jgi:hypothetical protein
VLLLSVGTACEVHVGDADWDAGSWDTDWDWDNDREGDPWESPRSDAGMPKGGSSAPGDEDSGAAKSDAAVSGGNKDAGTPASMLDAAVVIPGSEPDEPTVTLGMVAEFMARGSCGALEKCMGEELLRESLRGVDCVAFRTQVYANRELYWLAKSVAYGRVTFRADLLSACERDLLSRGCEVQSRRLPQSCRDALEGKAHVDEVCAIDQECAGASYCNKGLMESCPGTCASLQTSGLPCLASSECADGLVCRKGTCAVPLAAGDKCTVHLGYGECAPGLACQGAGTDKFTCRTIASVYAGKEGDTCDKTDKLCQNELVCQSQSATSLMGKCAKPVASGAVCRPSEPGQCPTGSYCKDARANVATRASAGTDGVCAALPADGATCLAAIGCKPGVICSSVDDKCHARQGVGESCVEDAQCYTSHCNAAGKCAAPIDCSP